MLYVKDNVRKDDAIRNSPKNFGECNLSPQKDIKDGGEFLEDSLSERPVSLDELLMGLGDPIYLALYISSASRITQGLFSDIPSLVGDSTIYRRPPIKPPNYRV